MENQKQMTHIADTLSEAIKLGIAELRTYYGDQSLAVTTTITGMEVKIEAVDTDKEDCTIWTFKTIDTDISGEIKDVEQSIVITDINGDVLNIFSNEGEKFLTISNEADEVLLYINKYDGIKINEFIKQKFGL